MSDYNHVGLSGRLTKDAETRFLPSGQSVTEFGLASNRKFSDKEETVFMDIVVWGKLGETLSPYLNKGQHVIVGGRLKQDSWEKDGVKRTKFVLIADTVDLSPKSNNKSTEAACNESVTELDVDSVVPF